MSKIVAFSARGGTQATSACQISDLCITMRELAHTQKTEHALNFRKGISPVNGEWLAKHHGRKAMRRFSNVVALALPVTSTVTKAQASTAVRLRQFGGFAVAIVIFICFGIRVALAVDTTNFNTFLAPIGNDTNGSGTAVIGSGVNNAGVVVGEFDDSKGGRHGFYFSDGIVTELSCPGATHTVANGINRRGVIVGQCFDPANGWQAFLYDGGRFVKFKYPGSTATFATAINNQNVSVGNFINTAGHWRGWSNYNGQFSRVRYPGAVDTVANAINNSNIICGAASREDGSQFGYSLNNGVYTAFVVPGATETACTGVSNHNKLVGYYRSTDESYHSFVLDSGLFTPINVPFQGASNTIVGSIMPNGVSVVGQYTSGSTTYGFFTGSVGNAGWPVNPEVSPLADKSFSGSSVHVVIGIKYIEDAITFTFYSGGNVGFSVRETQTDMQSPHCVRDDIYNYTSGSFYVEYASLHLNNLQGQHTHTDSCNPAQYTKYPIGPNQYDFQWEEGIAADGTRRLFLTHTGLPGLDNVLLVRD
jgi:probable HAF family extracellular repeat protein